MSYNYTIHYVQDWKSDSILIIFQKLREKKFFSISKLFSWKENRIYLINNKQKVLL